jgi:transposase-like protein
MTFNFKSVIELLDHFKDEKTCRAFYEQQRWGDKPYCPHCGSTKTPYRTDRGFKCSEKACYKKFSVTVGTIFEQSHIPLRTWFAAIYLITAHKKGISSLQLSRDLNITQKAAWFLLHRIREMLRAKSPVMLTKEVEVDETFIGGKEGNKHKNKKKGNYGRGAEGKIVVLGLVERDGKVVAKRIPDTKAESIIPQIEKHVEKGSTMLTDEWYAYGRLKGYTHKTIQHNLKIYVQGEVHTNTIENFWSVLKRGLYGIYHYTSKKHLDRYLDEFCARYNTRTLTESERFTNFLQQSESRLSWKGLVGAA